MMRPPVGPPRTEWVPTSFTVVGAGRRIGPCSGSALGCHTHCGTTSFGRADLCCTALRQGLRPVLPRHQAPPAAATREQQQLWLLKFRVHTRLAELRRQR